MPHTQGSALRDFLWMATGAALLLAVVLLAMRVNGGRNYAEQLVRQAEKLETTDAISMALESAAEAEKSAVLATTDDDAQAFAEQARAASRTVEARRIALERLLQTNGTETERERLTAFGRIFGDFQRLDDEILGLAVTNTNLKAYALAFGPAAETLHAMEAALSDLLTATATSPDRAAITALVLGAEVAALHVQTLLPPHIAEETDEKMAVLEAEMTHEVTTILRLSHENTDVRSLALSLRRKRQVTEACQHALRELHDAIKAGPIAGIGAFNPVSPR